MSTRTLRAAPALGGPLGSIGAATAAGAVLLAAVAAVSFGPMALGVPVVMVAGVVLTLVSWLATHGSTSSLDFADYNAMGTFGMSLTIAGTGPLPPLTVKAFVDAAALKKELPHLLGNVPDTQVSLALTGIADSAKKILTITADSTSTLCGSDRRWRQSAVQRYTNVRSWADVPAVARCVPRQSGRSQPGPAQCDLARESHG